MKKLSYLILTLMLVGCSEEAKIKLLDHSSISTDDLTQQVQSLIDTAKVAGLAISIFNDHEVVYKNTFGYSQIETKTPLSDQTIFYGASFSKAVFGYLVSQLAYEGLIELDTPLQSYLDQALPEIPFEKEWRSYKALENDKRYEQITARMCLSHSSGFPNWRWLSDVGEFNPEGKIRIVFEPGSRYSYSGEGMVLLQMVIETITGKGLEELARERIFDPLQMQQTSYVWQEQFEGNYCNGHTKDGEVIPKRTKDKANAAGSMQTTLDDYTRFCSKLIQTAQEDPVIKDLLFKPQIRIKSKAQFGPNAWIDSDENDKIELSYGLAWGLLQSPYGYGAFKEGHGEGFQHYSILFPASGIGIILMTNSDNGESIFKELLEISIGDIYTPWKWEYYTPYDAGQS